MSLRSSNRQRLYLAAPLFSSAEKTFNLAVATRLDERFDVYLPQRDGRLIVDLVSEGIAPPEAVDLIFRADLGALRESSLLVAVLDGRCIDEGVAFEIGVAYSLGIRCVGLQTDTRRLLPLGNNPMIQGAMAATVATVDELMGWLEAN
jgi:nucleoside 2-deoxyribosyltransferase